MVAKSDSLDLTFFDELYEAANADGKWTVNEINAFVDGLQAIVEDVDEIL